MGKARVLRERNHLRARQTRRGVGAVHTLAPRARCVCVAITCDNCLGLRVKREDEVRFWGKIRMVDLGLA